MDTELANSPSKRWGKEQYDRLTHPGLAAIIEHNIGAISKKRHKADATRNWHQQLADKMTQFAGSMTFVYLHVFWFATWVAVNVALVNFDPAFGTLTMIVSLEAIFLSTFILVSQNHQGALANRQAQLDLQITLLAEHEITRILKIVADLAKQQGLVEDDADVEELLSDIEPTEVLDRIEKDEQAESDAAETNESAESNPTEPEPARQ
jgi:uncharacterized membrane protein